MISVVTVPHTGTIYTLDLLRRWGVSIERKHLENTDPPPIGNFRFGPGFPCPSSDLWWSYPTWSGRRVVCTLRDPILAVISAINRRIPDRDISVDGWAVLADWHERKIQSVHFFTIPPTIAGKVELASFAEARGDWRIEGANLGPTNTSEDPRGIRRAYLEEGLIEHPTIERAIEQLSEMPPVWALFDDHGLPTPWLCGGS